MSTQALVQGSPEWVAARVGSLGASQVADATARTKTGWGASRANVMAALIAERLTGVPQESYTNGAMQRGLDLEPQARAAYEFHINADAVEIGLVRHPRIEGTHASPDGMVGEDGLVEIKCPNTATHIETLLGQGIPDKYQKQMLWQMACCERAWCDFVSYDPRLPPEMQLFVRRLDRDDKRIAELEEQVHEFLAELDGKVAALRKLYAMPEPKPEKPRRKWQELPAAAQIVLTCQSATFLRYIIEAHGEAGLSAEDAEAWVKRQCGVERKRDVLPGTDAFAKWKALHDAYTLWLEYDAALAEPVE